MFERIRNAVNAQIDERDRHFPDCRPGFPWHICTKASSYVLRLPADDLRSIRMHCDVMLGTQFAHALLHTVLPDLINRNFHYSWLGEGVPEELWATEPLVPALGDWPLGARMNGKIVNDGVCLTQRYLCNLLRLGLSQGQHVVEIGAGYGALAHAVLSARSVSYTIIDLPETLIYSACFLATHFPEKRFYIYEPGDTPDSVGDAEIVLLPNYRKEFLSAQPVDFAVNTVSFPEMERRELRGYLAALAPSLHGPLMSVNYAGNRGDGVIVPEILAEYFDLYPTPAEHMKALGIDEATYRHLLYRPTIICRKKGTPQNDVVLRDAVLGARIVTKIIHGVTSVSAALAS